MYPRKNSVFRLLRCTYSVRFCSDASNIVKTGLYKFDIIDQWDNFLHNKKFFCAHSFVRNLYFELAGEPR